MTNGDGMRLAAFALLSFAAIGTADAQAAKPCEVFRLGMTAAEVEAAAEAHGGRILSSEEENDFGISWKADEFLVVFGGIPMEHHQATGMFTFERDRLQEVRFDYFLWENLTPPGICNAIFEQTAREISEVYGTTSDLEEFSGTDAEFRGMTVNWSADEHTVSLFAADGPPHSAPGSCDIIQVVIFAGTQTELEIFSRRLRDAFSKTRQ